MTNPKINPLTSEELNNFYSFLPAVYLNDFRSEVINRCGMTYTSFHNKKNGKSKITKLESEAIREIMENFKMREPA